ncbi:MAG TPA: TonB-dependent receptor [Steroidobacteraceae bacterium]|nr:TonB-dependent receptor [Steroidobacteraceae bacterium]
MRNISGVMVSAWLLGVAAGGSVALAQQAPAGAAGGQKKQQLQEVIVTGSRIAQREAQREQPLSVISTAAIQKTGLADTGTLLQQLTTGGSALNAKFNSSGNFGYPPDGGGIGAGATEVDLRNLDPKRTLVLVDGMRWVNESSASGVSGSADLNTIPLSIIDHIEVLEDGASAIYGSDAIAGVVNIITKKRFDGVEASGYTGEYSKGGRTTQGSLTVGGTSGRFSGMFVASYYKQDSIGSSKWWQSAVPEPYAGVKAGSSATPQGRYAFCDPSVAVPNYGSCTADQSNFYDLTLNDGTTTPVWNPNDPTGGTYHNWGNADRFNYAAYNLLLTPQDRKSIFTNFTYTVNDNLDVYAKGLYNTRNSLNQAAPEPIFVGPYAGTGGYADNISVSGLNPYNPFGIDLNAASNLGWVTRRPIEAGPRIFTQTVDTWYFASGFKGHFGGASREDYLWDLNFVDSQNKAEQVFTGGYNIGNIGIALGDPAVCAVVPNCVPLDLFGGQGRPITAQMLNFIEAVQRDESEQDLKIISGNITGHPFSIEDRPVGIAIGAEHRQYVGAFNPDPLRQNGLSQDSPAQKVFGGYRVNEGYVEFGVPVLESLGASAAARYSDYSDFGSTTTYKAGLRWQPTHDFGLRGDYSTGFRAPSLGELYGLTQFGATLVDPCGPTGTIVVTPGNNSALAQACRAQGVPNGFQQANTQITTFTGGNARLRPERSKSFTAGFVYNASWAENLPGTDHLTLESTYYHHKVTGAIEAADIQSLLEACLGAGGTNPALCSGFTRAAGGNLNPPDNFLENLGDITTDGEDVKLNWGSSPLPFGSLSLAVMLTRVNGYKAVDALGNVSQRRVGIEVANSAIPRYRMNAQLGYGIADFQVTWTVRYLSSVQEYCSNATFVGVPGCATTSDMHTLSAVAYNDISAAYVDAFRLEGLMVQAGVNNLFGVNPPVCYSCTLNGYDAGTYDLPGAFWNVQAKYKF